MAAWPRRPLRLCKKRSCRTTTSGCVASVRLAGAVRGRVPVGASPRGRGRCVRLPRDPRSTRVEPDPDPAPGHDDRVAAVFAYTLRRVPRGLRAPGSFGRKATDLTDQPFHARSERSRRHPRARRGELPRRARRQGTQLALRPAWSEVRAVPEATFLGLMLHVIDELVHDGAESRCSATSIGLVPVGQHCEGQRDARRGRACGRRTTHVTRPFGARGAGADAISTLLRPSAKRSST